MQTWRFFFDTGLECRLHSVDTRVYAGAGRGRARTVQGQREVDVGHYRGLEGERGTASSVAQAEQPGVLENSSTGVLASAVCLLRPFTRGRLLLSRGQQRNQTATTELRR